MNLGLSSLIKSEFNMILPVERPVITTTNIDDPNWLSGFVSGDGNFDVIIRAPHTPGSSFKVNSPLVSVKGRVYLRFRISQHEKDTELMNLIINYLGAGRLEKDTRSAVLNLVIGNFVDLNQKILPFFKKYPLHGKKKLDFLDWCNVCNLIISESHLTNEGLEEIRQIKSKMNKGLLRRNLNYIINCMINIDYHGCQKTR